MLNNDINLENQGKNTGFIIGSNTGPIININTNREPKKFNSLMSKIVKLLANISFDLEENHISNDLTTFKIDEKLSYNNVIKNRSMIEDYSVYYTSFEGLLNKYDDSNFGSKIKILNYLHILYCEVKGELLLQLKEDNRTNIEKIQDNADLLIDLVSQRVKEIIYNSDEEWEYYEDIEIGIKYCICYCFMECKILEKPI